MDNDNRLSEIIDNIITIIRNNGWIITEEPWIRQPITTWIGQLFQFCCMETT